MGESGVGDIAIFILLRLIALSFPKMALGIILLYKQAPAAGVPLKL